MSILEVHDITFRFDDQIPLLESWSARFDEGALYAITGPSGRGKSTLLYVLGLMLRPQGGRIVLSGRDVAGISDAERARLRATHFGFVFQDAALDLSRSVLSNVVEGALYRGTAPGEVRSRALDLLTELGVELRVDARPGQVSGGQAQRVALCRALLGEPAVMLADEPTGNLDPETAGMVLQALRQRAEAGSTVVIVTHDPAVTLRCDRHIVL